MIRVRVRVSFQYLSKAPGRIQEHSAANFIAFIADETQDLVGDIGVLDL